MGEFRRSGPRPENLGEPPPGSDLLTEGPSAEAVPFEPDPWEAGSLLGGGSESTHRGDDPLGFGAKPQARAKRVGKQRAKAPPRQPAVFAVDSPGSSNTRALTPAVSKTSMLANEPPPLLLSCRVDALTIAYRGELSTNVFERIAACLEEAKLKRVQVPIELAGYTFALQPDGAKSFCYRIVNGDLTVLAGEGVSDFRVQIKASATYLATNALEDVLAVFERIARKCLTGTIEEARVWRLDLCADATNLQFNPRDSENFVGRARKRVQCETRELTEGGAQKFTGFLIARGNPLSMRLYDKTEELKSQHLPDSIKTRTECAIWSAAGWDGEAQVWRLEFQLRSKALDELRARDPNALVGQLDNLWSYLVGAPNSLSGWIRLTVPCSGGRRERRLIDLRWELFRQAVFMASSGPAVRVSGNSKGATIQQAMGVTLSTLGSWGRLSESGLSPEETVRADLELLASRICSDPRLLKRYVELRAGKKSALSEMRRDLM